MTQLTDEQLAWAREMQLCGRDLHYLAANYLHVKSKHQLGFPTFKFYPVQRYLYDAMMDQKRRTGKIRQIWGKARQIGSSTLAIALVAQQTMFKPYRHAMIIAQDEDAARERFDTYVTYYHSLPAPLRPVTKYDSRFKMEFTDTKSKALAAHARNPHVGAGESIHVLHMTEAARYPHADVIYDALWPAMSDAAGEDDFSAVIIESTSYIGGEWYKNLAEAAMAGESEFEFHFVPAYQHHQYRRPVPRGFTLTPEEKDIVRKHQAPLEFLVWRRLQLREYRSNPALFYQNYPNSWEESWILPEGAMIVFSRDMLAHTQDKLSAGERYDVSTGRFTPLINGHLEVWALPKSGRFYDIGLDIAEGRTEQADWTVLEVLDRQTLEQVAEARLHVDPASQDFVDLVYWTGMLYNRAQICPDITGGWGHALMHDLQRRAYPNLWQWRRRDDLRDKLSTRVGFLYTKRDKSWLVTNAVRTLEHEHPVIHSIQLYDELPNFLNLGEDEWAAKPGYKDDCVNAYMLALLSATDDRRPTTPPPEPPKPKPDPWLIHDIDGELQQAAIEASPFTKPWS